MSPLSYWFLPAAGCCITTTMRAFRLLLLLTLLLISLLMMISSIQPSPPAAQYSLITRPLSFVPPRQGRKLATTAPALASPELDGAAGRNLKKDQLGDGRMQGRAGDDDQMGDPVAGGGVENKLGVVYEVDYHGVTTHPSPRRRPKHPKLP